jgi:hypothetical protein
LSLLIDASERRWFVLGSRAEITAIVARGLSHGNGASKTAREIVNRLAADGHTNFAGLLVATVRRGLHHLTRDSSSVTSDPVTMRSALDIGVMGGAGLEPAFATFLATRPAGEEKVEEEKPLSGAFRNGPAWIRTRDQRIMSPLL